jgi:alkaline phosphatase D
VSHPAASPLLTVVDRRALLRRAATLSSLALSPLLPACFGGEGGRRAESATSAPGAPTRAATSAPVTPAAVPTPSSYPFTLGIASGDPLPDGVVLWTRLAPDPLHGGGMPNQEVSVEWQIATDDALRNVVQQGTEPALPEWAHAVHVEVRGLEPARWYWYRFRVTGGPTGTVESPIGRTRTAPSLGAALDRFRFAFVSCQNWQDGYFTAHRYLAKEDLELVVHLGDYIYESAIKTDAVRPHDGAVPTTLDGYRRRYALYKTDPDLQAAHAAFPWVLTWDDHEVVDNYAGSLQNAASNRESFLLRRAAAYRAYYEHQPLRRSSLPSGPDLLLYRRLAFGDLLQLAVLDTRQYRDVQPICVAAERVNGYCPAALDPQRTVLGETQRRWLMDGLDRSAARWNVIANQVIFSQHDNRAGPEREFGNDKWDGYVADRQAVLDFLAQRRPSNPVIITGDIHQNRVYDVKGNFDDPASETLATEYVGTSISSGGDVPPATAYSLPDNPHQRFRNSNRGYVRCELTRDRWQADFRTVTSVHTQTGTITTTATFVTPNGHAGAQRA